MIEYLYDAIRATSGDDIVICACIRDEDGNLYGEGSQLCLYDEQHNMITMIKGEFNEENEYQYTIPAETTKDRYGRYWYAICDLEHNALSFKQPIYLV